MTKPIQHLRAEIERTLWQSVAHDTFPSIADTIEHEGKTFVCLADSNVSWWQPVDGLLAKLSELPDASEPEDEQADAEAYGAWCTATRTAEMYDGTTGSFPVAPWEADAA